MENKEKIPTNLSRVLALYSISRQELGATLSMDPSQISRWATGRRPLSAKSEHAHKMALIFLSETYRRKQKYSTLLFYLEKEMGYGIPRYSKDICPNSLVDILAKWLVKPIPDKLSNAPLLVEAIDAELLSPTPNQTYSHFITRSPPENAYTVISLQDMFQILENSCRTNRKKKLLIYIPIDANILPMDGDFLDFWRSLVGKSYINIKVILATGRKTGNLNALLAQWVPLLLKGQLEILSVPDDGEIAHPVFMMYQGDCLFNLLQLTTNSRCLALYTRDLDVLTPIRLILEEASVSAQSFLTIYDDSNANRIHNLFMNEYTLAGASDLFQSGLNMMFLGVQDFQRILIRNGAGDAEIQVRTAFFERSQSKMCERLQKDHLRELLSIPAIESMRQVGCTMPSIHFGGQRLMKIDCEDVAALCRGYAAFLRKFDTLDVRLSENSAQFVDNFCWRIKHRHHVLLHTWSRIPLVIHIENKQLIEEFEQNYNLIWNQGTVQSRSAVIDRFDEWGQWV